MSKIRLTIKDKKPIKLKLETPIIELTPPLENIIITPSKEEQTFKSENYYGYDEVKVEGVSSKVDNNIKSENIKQGVDILGVTGTMPEINTTEVHITPSSEEQTITPEEPYNGFNKVIVGAQSGINPAEMFNTTMDSFSASNFCSKNMLIKTPTINIEPSVKVLDFLLANWNGTFVPRFNCAKGQITSISNLCANSEGVYDLETLFEDIDTSKVVTFSNILTNPNIKRVGVIDCSSCTNISALTYTYQTWDNITYIGGFKDLGKAYLTARNQNYASYRLNLALFPNLTPESVIQILDSVYDIASIGVKRQQIYIHANAMSVLKSTEEGQQALANVDAKGWNTPDV